MLKVKSNFFAPNHFVDHTYVGLDDADYLGTYILIYIVGNRYAGFVVLDELYSYIYTLQEALGVNATENKAALVKCLGALSAGADSHRRERMVHGGEEGVHLWQSTAVTHHRRSIHLQAIVVVEAQGFMLDSSFIELESRSL